MLDGGDGGGLCTLTIPPADSSTPISAVLPPDPPMSVCTQPGCTAAKLVSGKSLAKQTVSMLRAAFEHR